MVNLKPNSVNMLIFAAIIIAFFLVMPVNAGAQTQPEPTPVCWWVDEGLICINQVSMTPSPTATRTPVLGPPPLPTVTGTVDIQPHPTATPSATPTPTATQPAHIVYLSLIKR